MEVEVVGRVKPGVSVEDLGRAQLLHVNAIGSFKYGYLYQQAETTTDVYRKNVEPLVDLFVNGFNVAFMAFGETSSGKTFMLAGDSMNKFGVVPLAIDGIFQRMSNWGSANFAPGSSRLHRPDAIGVRQFPGLATFPKVTVKMYEVFNENVRDLLALSSVVNTLTNVDLDALGLEETPELGVQVKNSMGVRVSSAGEAVVQFRNGLDRRVHMTTELGRSEQFSATIFRIELEAVPINSSWKNKSIFTFVELPGTELLTMQATGSISIGNMLTRGMKSVEKVLKELSENPNSDRVVDYHFSKLTDLLQEELGGNCRTVACLCLREHTPSEVLERNLALSDRLTRTRNFPVINDELTLALHAQYRARIISLKKLLGMDIGRSNPAMVPTNIDGLRRELNKVQAENIEVRDANERLHFKLDEMQAKYGNISHTKTDLSAQLLMTEEEKLKVSKALVELEIENNRVKEEVERVKFELSNKILQLENELFQALLFKERYESMKEQYERLAQEHRDLTDEYVSMKNNYLNVVQENDRLVKKNEELSVEMINLLNSKATLIRQLDNFRLAGLDIPVGVFPPDPDGEIERIKAMIGRYSAKGPRRLALGESSNRLAYEADLSHMRNQYDEQQQRLEVRIASLLKELLDEKRIAQERMKKLAEADSQVILLRQENAELTSENNRLQHKVRDIYDEYKTRLVKYVSDIASYVDKIRLHQGHIVVDDDDDEGVDSPHSASSSTGSPHRPRGVMRRVAVMLRDIKAAHNDREDQLSSAAISYKNKLINLTKKHERLLVEYRKLIMQVQDRPELFEKLEAKPFEDVIAEITLHQDTLDTELLSHQEKQIRELQGQLERVQLENDSLRLQARSYNGNELPPPPGVPLPPGALPPCPCTGRNSAVDSLGPLRRQVKDFTSTTQQQLEEERARLLTKVHVLEGQLKECQEYIDTYLTRYKQEIYRLRRQQGSDDNDPRRVATSNDERVWNKLKNRIADRR